jgi:hypothetical protein
MPIIVVCPGCRKSFSVNEKFAGKSGPCPNCKQILRVPTKTEEVKIHVPEAFAGGGKSTQGKLITKPIARTDVRLQPVAVASIVASVLVVLVVTWIGGQSQWFDPWYIQAIGLLLVSPPLVIAAYAVLRDAELEPFRGKALGLRAAGCGLAYIVLWGVFAALKARGVITGELWIWLFLVPPFVALGGGAAMALLNLEFGDGMLHYGFYLVATLLLRWVAGMKWVWDL